MRFAFRRDVALGRYVSLDTPVHRLDPRTKLLGFAVVLAALFRAGETGCAGLVLLLGGLTTWAGMPVRRTVGALKGMAWILALTVLFQALWVGPRHLGGIAAGLHVGIEMGLRLVGMLVAAMLLTFSTEPIRLADGLGRLFGFLERLRVPVRDLAMVLTLALRFLPTVLEEAERLVTAQRARGARFGGGLLTRARRVLPLAVPLFTGCLRRADRLALAMEARGYRGGASRTQLDPPAFGRGDGVALIALTVLLAVVFGAPAD
jgi:energy-coupling factor transport system permease protein